ncbi:YbaY family lipoprotein [Leptodesmis sichuanensis]|uniref:YbaY family lipoprotein n=1 Tax=Leptodesmis sichuanensis TaxID=2906798 RepID=UPI001F395A29|nr:YbaY family lipoprotein [Leptodesmis sichuanensis A121]
MRSLIASALTLLTGLLPLTAAVAQEEMQPPQPLTINFETQGCGRFPQEAYYETQFHFVNICRGEANLQMVVTDADGLGRERIPAEKQSRPDGIRFVGQSDRKIGYAIDNQTFTIVFPDQKPYQEKVTRFVFATSPTTKPTTRPTTKPMNLATVTGNVTYRPRIALPPNAVVKVSLQDVSRADAPAIVLDEQTIPTNGQQVPIPFTLRYDPSQIKPHHSYAVSARILVNGRLQWISTTRNSVITKGNPTSNVTVLVQQVPRR